MSAFGERTELRDASTNNGPAGLDPLQLRLAHACHRSAWPIMSQCTTKPATYKYTAANYQECKTKVLQTGWEPSAAWWYCSSQGFKQ
jgi:hypothetical protein